MAVLHEPRTLGLYGADLYAVELINRVVRRIDLGSHGLVHPISTLAGEGDSGSLEEGVLALNAFLGFPLDVLRVADHVVVSDGNSLRVRSVDLASGLIWTVAGSGTNGWAGDGSDADTAAMGQARGLAAVGDLLFMTHNNEHGPLLRVVGFEEPQALMQRGQDITDLVSVWIEGFRSVASNGPFV